MFGDLEPLQIKFIGAVFGPIWCIIMMCVGHWFLDKITPYNTSKELDESNIAVGIVVGSIFISIGICTGLTVMVAVF